MKNRVFDDLNTIPNSDVEGRVKVVDQEKSIDSTYRIHVGHYHLVLDPLHVEKNMKRAIGEEKTAAIALYVMDVHAPRKTIVNSI